jgi:hypothetical protein
LQNFQELNLSHNRITDEGAAALAVFLSSGRSTLCQLDLSLNMIRVGTPLCIIKAGGHLSIKVGLQYFST